MSGIAEHAIAATVEWCMGNRMISTVMRNADMGIEWVGVKEVKRFIYAPGEIVTEERVMKAIHEIMRQSDEEKTEWQIHNPRVISIHPIIEPQQS